MHDLADCTSTTTPACKIYKSCLLLPLQATFAATETVGALRALAAGVLAPQLAPAAYLYTTPPRTVLKGDSDSLYHCGLVPAAHVHVGVDDKKGEGEDNGVGRGRTGPHCWGGVGEGGGRRCNAEPGFGMEWWCRACPYRRCALGA